MNRKSLQVLIVIFCFFLAGKIFAQVGYQKDSLQIKVYTEAEFRNGLVKEIHVKNIFCDYCTEYQKKRIEEEAIRRTYLLSSEDKTKISTGMFKHALYIRISKEDFSEMKKDSLTDNN